MPQKSSFQDLIQILQDLRHPETGCPWDKEQSFESIAPHTIEEAYEVENAILNKDMDNLKEELGDLLLQVIYHSQIASEKGLFTINDVVQSICEKMVRRHPHIYTDTPSKNLKSKDIEKIWNTVKSQEKPQPSEKAISDDIVPVVSPALKSAQKISKKAVSYGFEWDSVQGIYDKIDEEITEVKDAKTHTHRQEEIGDLLFSVVNLARAYGIDSETALKKTNIKFKNRFNAMMQILQNNAPNTDNFTLQQMESAWNIVKTKEKAL